MNPKAIAKYWNSYRKPVLVITLFSSVLGVWGVMAGLWGYILVFCPLTIIGIYLIALKPKDEEEEESTDHGSAKWSSIAEFEADIEHNTQKNGLWVGDGFWRTRIGNLITFAPPRSGKGTNLIIPTLLMRPGGSFVVTDPKGENACITARAQEEMGQKVYIIDPWDEQGAINAIHGIKSSGFNPFDFLRLDPTELPDNCEMIANFLVPQTTGREKYWDDRARTIIKMMLVHIITSYPLEKQNFRTLNKLLRGNTDELVNTIFEMKKNPVYKGLIQTAASEIEGLITSPETFASVMSNAHNATKIFESEPLTNSLMKSEFNPLELSEGKTTVYFVLPEKRMETHAAWLKIAIGLSLKAVNAKPKNRVNFLIDEAGVLGKISEIKTAYSFGPGQNIVMWMFFQNVTQLKELYGEDGMNSIINASAQIIAFNLRDRYSQKYISDLLGESTRIKTDTTIRHGEAEERRTSFGRPLLTPEEVGTTKGMITIAESTKIIVNKAPYYSIGGNLEVYFKKMADPAPRIH